MDDLIHSFLSMKSRDRQREFKTPGEMAGELNVTASRVRQLVDEGKLPAVRILGRIYIHRPKAIDQLLKDSSDQQN